ncbi:hypothetical protein HRD49_41710 [Corallococcus exiguus]|uniref:hypothetical protein n=1 Tax=Corallococcus exiguus TaxID=83462 RepID=UPI001560AB0C|nr:hypothetical protein [Corallococcus exiguus]NRD68262.1 hypothetical protein [Corallococcus exiguus]
MSALSVKEMGAAFRLLVQEVELAGMTPLGYLARMAKAYPEPGTGLETDVKSVLAAAPDATNERGFLVRGDFIISVRAESASDKPEEPFLKLRYTVLGQYVVGEGFTHALEDALLKQFAETNAMVHFWPYLRSFVSGACGELNIPPIMLPLLKPPKILPASQPADE